MLPYRLITSGKNKRREYFSLNNSPLFTDLPDLDFAKEQKASYNKFLREKLPKILSFYFPAEFNDYNNRVKITVRNVECKDPDISEDEARVGSLTWNYDVSFRWSVVWDCERIQIQLHEGNDLILDISKWIEESFKIGKFDISQKSPSTWSIRENSKSENGLNILLEEKERNSEFLIVKFNCKKEERLNFCHLPKMNDQGNFIINGHDKVVVFQSVRAPSVYFFANEEEGFHGEIIPFKGPWISLSYSAKNPRSLELKFLNSKVIISVLEVFKTFLLPAETLYKLFSEEDLNIDDYELTKPLEVGSSMPQFLFENKNSYFDLGKLGRKKYIKKSGIFNQLKDQILAEDVLDKDGTLILPKNEKLSSENLNKLRENLCKVTSVKIPHSSNELYLFRVFSPSKPGKIVSLIGVGEDISYDKTYMDLSDLICIVSNQINLHYGIGVIEKEEEKDKLENQIVRRVGDLVYNIFDNKFGGFLQDINNGYLANISQLKKADLTKIPNLKDFDNLIKNFFNTSALVQLQNQNNPLSEASYTRKLSVLGLGGFSSANTTLAARNVNSSYYGRYDLVETPEGQRVGLIHNLTVGAAINDYGQVTASYYPVKKGIIEPNIVYLTSEDGWDKHMIHCNIGIDENNRIVEEKVIARYKGEFVLINSEKADYIDSSFYQLNSITSATIPFFQHNDATRMLMASNMQRQALTLVKNEPPLVASGMESSLLKNSSLVVKSDFDGIVKYVDCKRIIIKHGNKEKEYNLKQLVVSNKNVLNFSIPLVKKGQEVKKGQIISHGNYAKDEELSLGYNLRVAYLCWNGYNYEDAIIINDRLVREDILTSFYVKKHVVIRRETKIGPEKFTPSFPDIKREMLPNLDDDGIIKIGSEVSGNDILVGKITPEIVSNKETEEELLLMSILGDRAQKFLNTSLRLPAGDRGIVYDVKRKELKGKNEIEIVEVYVAHERKIEVGDKLTTRFGNKGVVSKIVPDVDMPFDEDGKTIDIIFNPLGIPSRMNVGQLLETIFASAAKKLGSGFLVRPFNTPSIKSIKKIVEEAGIKDFGNQKLFDGRTGLAFEKKIYSGYIYTIKLNHMVTDKFHARNTGPYSLIYQQPLKGRAQAGGQRVGEMEAWALEAHGAPYNLMEMMSAKSDDIYKRRSMQNSLIFDDRQVDLRSSQSESFNLLLQYLWGIGFDLKATDSLGKEVDFYESFSRKNRKKNKICT